MAADRMPRRLAAILAADIAGYSRLTGADEEGTVARLRALRTELIDPAIAAHDGRIVKTAGDGMLIEFGSVVDAVRAAVEVQAAMTARNAPFAPDKRIAFRVGIHLGDVLVQPDGDLLGDGVNIAARLEGIAEPGGICLSRAAHEQVEGKVEASFADLGEQALKNIARPIRVFAFSPSNHSPAPANAAPAEAPLPTSPRLRGEEKQREALRGGGPAAERGPPRLSIVVLPFANIGGDPEQEYFVDGVTESLTTDLSRIAGSFVIARNTAFTYKGKPVDVTQIGRELNVRYVLEGSVQRGGNRLRVNVQLIDADTGNHLWAERFDKPLADLFDMQDEIVARLARQLDAELMAAEARRAAGVPNPNVMDLCFQGAAWRNKGGNPEDLARARHFYERALVLDPDNVEAMVGLAYIDTYSGPGVFSADRAARAAAAEAMLTKALARDPNHAFGHQCLGFVQIFTDRGSQAIAEGERALALDRNSAVAHALIGLAKFTVGRAEETEAHIRDALRLSPRDVTAYLWLFYAGIAKLWTGADEEAVVWLQQAVGANSTFSVAHFYLGAAFALLGRRDEARMALKPGLALDPGFTLQRLRAGHLSNNPTYLAQALRAAEGLRLAGVPEGEPEKPAAARLSIVVLPFANIGGDTEQEYFVDGVTESLTTDLSRIAGSFVIARNTAFTYKGKPVDVKQIGRELNVRYVLEGSVQKGGNRLRVNVQLIDAETGNHLWAERFDKPVADLFDMQDEIVARLARQLSAELINIEARRAETSSNPDSMALYFQGMAAVNKAGRLTEAKDLFLRALALDPENVEALVGLAYTDVSTAGAALDNDPLGHLAAAEATATQAISLAPNHAAAHRVLGWVYQQTRRGDQAIAECELALALDPNHAPAHGTIGLAKVIIGRPEETERHIIEALRLSPRDTLAYQWLHIAGMANLTLGRDAEAAAWYRKSIERNRNFFVGHCLLAAALVGLGKLEEARVAAKAALTLNPGVTIALLRRVIMAATEHPVVLAQAELQFQRLCLAGMPEE